MTRAEQRRQLGALIDQQLARGRAWLHDLELSYINNAAACGGISSAEAERLRAGSDRRFNGDVPRSASSRQRSSR